VAALDRRVTLAVDAADDHGLRRLEVVSQAGNRPATVTAVPLPAGGTERVMAPVVLDLTDQGLVPGDTVSYYAVAGDNSPAGQAGRSRTYRIVVPTPADQRAARRRHGTGGAKLDSDEAARRLEHRRPTSRASGSTGESARGEPAMDSRRPGAPRRWPAPRKRRSERRGAAGDPRGAAEAAEARPR
jgi:hypothetical protein